jgi:two-component system sensor histidine kinase HydH
MQKKHSIIPKTSPPRRVSKSAVAIIVASLILAVLLGVSIIRNFNKEEQLIRGLLLREALNLVRTFEAGARTTMQNYRQGTNPLVTLVNETVKEDSISYIRIVDEQGKFIAGAGEWFEYENRPKATQVLNSEKPFTMRIKDRNIFEVATIIDPLTCPDCQGPVMQKRWRSACNMVNAPGTGSPKTVIFIGLRTDELNEARHEDVHHAFFMYGILFLVGTTGLYFLFFYQKMQVARTTLSNMRLYTENIIESMPAGLISLDTGARVVSCNSHTEELVGVSFSEMEGKTLVEIFPDSPLGEFDPQKTVLDSSIDVTDRDGNLVPLKISSSQMRDHAGEVIGTVLILRDMREIRKMERKLERSRRLAALGQMATAVAHEIRNPLGTLRGFAQYCRSQAEENSENHQYAELMMSEVDRLNQTISGMLQFSRQREPDMTEVDMKELLEKTATLMAPDFISHNISMHLDVEEDVRIEADPDMLLQVLLNLIGNSIHATPEGGKITVSVKRSGETVRIEVKDTGRGMTESERDKMFNPFFTTRKKGTGLGLAVSHQIVEQHDGHFETESSPGKGTTITVVLPLSQYGNGHGE